MNERSRLLILNVAVWTVVTVITIVFALLGRIPWDGYAHLPWWQSGLLGLLLSSLVVGLIFWLTRDKA